MSLEIILWVIGLIFILGGVIIRFNYNGVYDFVDALEVFIIGALTGFMVFVALLAITFYVFFLPYTYLTQGVVL